MSICKVRGDLTERMAQHDDYGHFGEKMQFSPGFLEHIQGLDVQKTPIFLLAIQKLIFHEPTQQHWRQTQAE